jgi:hypothetical protein
LRVLGQQLLLRRERAAVVLHVGVADADPVARIGCQRARGIVLHERPEGVDRGRKVVAPEEVRGGVVGLRFARLVVLGRRLGRLRGRRDAGVGRRLRRRGRATSLEPLESRVEVEVEVALALLHLLVLVGEDLELPAQARDLGIELVELAHQLDHADVADAFLEACDARLVVLALLAELLAQALDAPAGLVVVEEARSRGNRRREQQRGDCGSTRPCT